MSQIEIEDINWQILMISSAFIMTAGLNKINLVQQYINFLAKVQLSPKIDLN